MRERGKNVHNRAAGKLPRRRITENGNANGKGGRGKEGDQKKKKESEENKKCKKTE